MKPSSSSFMVCWIVVVVVFSTLLVVEEVVVKLEVEEGISKIVIEVVCFLTDVVVEVDPTVKFTDF